MNRYPLWKYILIAVVLVTGFLFTMPNFFGESPAVQVSLLKPTAKIDAAMLGRVEEIRHRCVACAARALIVVKRDYLGHTRPTEIHGTVIFIAVCALHDDLILHRLAVALDRRRRIGRIRARAIGRERAAVTVAVEIDAGQRRIRTA